MESFTECVYINTRSEINFTIHFAHTNGKTLFAVQCDEEEAFSGQRWDVWHALQKPADLTNVSMGKLSVTV